MWCHVLLMTPILGLGLFFVLPFPLALFLYLILGLASLFLYGKIMESMQKPVVTGREGLLGQIVTTKPNGWVHWRGEWWLAEPALSNQRVKIVDLRGLRIQVEPIAGSTDPIPSPEAPSCRDN